MKRALKRIGKVLAWTLAVAISLALILLAEPRWVLNTKTVSWGLKKFGADYRPAWRKLSFEIRNDNLLTKRILFDAEGLCFDEKHGELKACFPALDLDATVHFGFSPVFSVRRLEKLVVHSSGIALDETAGPPQKKAKKKKGGGNFQLVPGPVRRMTVGLLDVRVPKATVVSSSATTTASLRAAFTEEGKAPLTADAEVVVSTGPKAAQHYRAGLRLDSDLLRLGRATYLDLTARLRGDNGLAADVAAKLSQPKAQELKLLVTALAQAAGRKLQARVDGTPSAERQKGTATLAVVDPSGPAQRVELKNCRFDAPLERGHPKRQDLTCGLVIEPAPLGAVPKGGPKVLGGRLAYHSDFKGKSRFSATLKADLGPRPRGKGFIASIEAALAGRTDKLPRSLTAGHKLDVSLTIERFQELVAYLSRTAFAVPAPIDAFDGPVTLRLRTTGSGKGESQRLEYEAKTDLSSQKQRLKTRVSGRVDVQDMFLSDRSIKDVTEVVLEDVALQLPYLKLGPVPSPIVDKRIKTGNPRRDAAADAMSPTPQARQKPSAVDYDARVTTGKPIRLLTNLLKEPIPIGLDLRARTEGLSGKITIEPFDVKIFHQTAKVDHITLSPSPGSSDMTLDGKIVYKKNDVTIDILLVGSTAKPTITLESDPPMTQNEIMAVLLFDKSPAELDSDQQASAGTATQAMTSGAFGLASLYLFASTPVQSVGYDPATQTYDVKFKLPGGATLGVGSNLQESRTLSLRKRIAHNVEVETQLQRNSQQQGPQGRDAITTFLEWFRRY